MASAWAACFMYTYVSRGVGQRIDLCMFCCCCCWWCWWCCDYNYSVSVSLGESLYARVAPVRGAGETGAVRWAVSQ
ncbi:hypothetical protein BO70DRAFT_28357 [Aspergillus heteromorphus CBS 117.55]|uniref:Uncharacterized protein n=1 Tax=Aspergillus heteromorphus CBS 117.55 TaxID=1448321 RepID=A0A317WAM4_9EURO|nr:uncharacterized protein BO70DRAFT_28357 [Aspergillus heteromorphus CBS 117.55]PWY83554.1 hypothetical protein BO70DRAFT_28357 [Aspergillus heteromorphus CBS 117.55]